MEDIFTKKQITKRKGNQPFSIEDHYRAMVYAMLSASHIWDLVLNDEHKKKGTLHFIDKIFNDFDISNLPITSYDSEEKFIHKVEKLCEKINKTKCAAQQTVKQMIALFSVNIPKLKQLESEYGSIDDFYQRFINIDPSFESLIFFLSFHDSKYKYDQMGKDLVTEYLRYLGYDLPIDSSNDETDCIVMSCYTDSYGEIRYELETLI